VEVTGCEVSGEGRTPGSWSMGVGASGVVVVGDAGAAGWRPMPMLRLRKAILSSSIVVCGVQCHESGSEVGVVGRGF
jgi:hypothetical protein